MFYRIFRPIIFLFDAEKAHNIAIFLLRFLPRFVTLFALNKKYENLNQNIFGITFENPIGMAAGFDKNAEVFTTLHEFGFGFVEVGTVTPKPQSGNEKPRLFRLKEDRAIINRFGFNNCGAEKFEKNISKKRAKNSILGVNIGKNKDQTDAASDYLALLEKFYEKASYITINISSPNTKNLRDLQQKDQLESLLSQISEKKKSLQNSTTTNTPILLKVAPDLTFEEQERITELVLKYQIDGLIVSNTTIDRDLNLRSKHAAETGGLSGKPLRDKSNQVLKNFYKLTEGKIPLIGVGGISNAQDAYEKIKCGASLVQIYSAFIYEGFGLVEKTKKDLSKMVENDGFKNIKEAIGSKN